MKKNAKFEIFITLIFIVLMIPLIVEARYFEKIEKFSGRGSIAEPIFKVNQLQDTVTQTINKESGEITYEFTIKNYEIEDISKAMRISQVDMNYNIEIINENKNFPIKYELYEKGEKNNLLNENGKTLDIFIEKNIVYEKNYQLVVTWENKEVELANADNIKININSSQVK